MTQAPKKVDCASFVKWIYGQIGIWLPRRSIQQYIFGSVVADSGIKVGDLVFKRGRTPYYLDDPKCDVGHVGIVTLVEADGSGLVVHATQKHNVYEVSLKCFTESRNYRGSRRIVPRLDTLMTLFPPPELEIETSDDLKWLLLTNYQ